MNTSLKFSCLVLLAAWASSAQAQCYRLVWADEFDGTALDTTAWSYQIGNGCPALCGWGNDEQEWYQRDNLEVSGGTMKIHVREETVGTNSYTSSRIRTFEKMHWTTGRFEARMKMPTGQGLWPAFWMLPEESHYGTWPMSGEIDIMEMIGSQPATTFGTIHYGPAYPANQYAGNTTTLPSGILADDFHEFAVEWEAEEIRWYIDGALYHTMNPDNLLPYPWRFNRDFHLLLNVAVGGYFPGYPDATTVFPQVMEVDYVRVYQDVNTTTISGPALVSPSSEDVRYYVQPVEGALYTWTAPSGASIASGQGTTAASVNWGKTPGALQVAITSPGCSAALTRPIAMLQPDCSDTLLDFEGQALISWISTDGVYEDDDVNPGSDGVNSSTSVARYERNPAVSYNVLRYTADGFSDAGPYKNDSLILEMDVYTNAPAGAQITMQMENMQLAALSYPSGRNSVYQAITSRTNAWETMRFAFSMAPDGLLADNSINQFLILFQPGTSSSNVFWFDNLRVSDASCLASGLEPVQGVQSGSVWPNPFQGGLNWSGSQPALEAALLDASGRLVLNLPVQQSTTLTWNLPALASGAYWLRVRTEAGWSTYRLSNFSER